MTLKCRSKICSNASGSLSEISKTYVSDANNSILFPCPTPAIVFQRLHVSPTTLTLTGWREHG